MINLYELWRRFRLLTDPNRSEEEKKFMLKILIEEFTEKNRRKSSISAYSADSGQ